MLDNNDLNRLLDIAENAAKLILKFYKGDFKINIKSDNSPVTEADLEASNYIEAELARLFPEIPVISEENYAIEEGADLSNNFWLIDPLDGTKGFINKSDEFAINIALVSQFVPKIGLIAIPVQGVTYFNFDGKIYKKFFGNSEWKEVVRPKVLDRGVIIAASQVHRNSRTDEYIRSLNAEKVLYISSAIKYCMLVDASADVYPSFGRTCEWDTAAGHAMLLEIGGDIKTLDGHALTYGKEGFKNPGFIAGFF